MKNDIITNAEVKFPSSEALYKKLERATQTGEIYLQTITHVGHLGKRIPDNCLPGIRSIGFWDVKRDQTWGINWLRRQNIGLVYVESGSIGFTSPDSEPKVILPGHLIITRPWQMAKSGEPNITSSLIRWVTLDINAVWPNQKWIWPDWIILTESDKQELESLLRNSTQSVFPVNSAIDFNYNRIGRLFPLIDQPLIESQMRLEINNLIINILTMLRSQSVELQSDQTTALKTVELFFKALSLSQDELRKSWSIKQMANECGMSETFFNICCHKQFNTTPGDRLRTMRLTRAAELLVTQPELKVTEISALCGFTRQTYFTAAFTSEFGQSPREYRKSHIKDNESAS